MVDTKANMFNNAMTDSLYDSVYDGWSNDLISAARMTDRTVSYDSNIALTDGNGKLAMGNARSIPNLYETLNGLNKRITQMTAYISTDEVSYLNVNLTTGDNPTVTVKGRDKDITGDVPLALSCCSSTFAIGADDFTFKFKNGAEYTMEDIFAMIEELDARTRVLKTTMVRAPVTEKYINVSEKAVLSNNYLADTTEISFL